MSLKPEDALHVSSGHEAVREGLLLAREWATDWLFHQALPLWWAQGADHVGGGFHEKLDQQGAPVGKPTRVRVQARQIYVYAQAGMLGWSGPWHEAMLHGAEFMLTRYSRSDGLFRSTVFDDVSIDLYDQAFALFALAQLYAADGRRPEILARALELLQSLDDHLGHPMGGYEEANPRRLPLRSNPHMHLLEALLAWVEVGVADPFQGRARRLVTLAMSHMIDPDTQAIGEYFDGDWRLAPGVAGTVREPGHQFEWAYLFALSDRLVGTHTGLACDGLLSFGLKYGIDATRGVAVFSVGKFGEIVDPNARLWAQTEWLRVCLTLAEPAPATKRVKLYRSALDAFTCVRSFLNTEKPGLWHEWSQSGASFNMEPSPASSLYHIVAAFRELLKADRPGLD